MRVSPSQLKTYKECEQQWYYSYIDNLKPKMRRTVAVDVGNYTHELMHVMYQFLQAFPDVKPGSDEVMDMMMARIKNDVENGNLDSISTTNIVMKLMTRYITWQSPRIDKGITVLGVEKDFMITLGNFGLILNGFIDLVYRDAAGNIRIRDHKTSGQKNSWNEKKLKLLEQLLLYCLAMQEELKEPVLRVEVNYVNTYQYAGTPPPSTEIYKIFRHTHTPAVLDSYRRNLELMHDRMVQISEGASPIRNFHDGCGSCRFYELCNLETKGLDSSTTKQYLFQTIDKNE